FGPAVSVQALTQPPALRGLVIKARVAGAPFPKSSAKRKLFQPAAKCHDTPAPSRYLHPVPRGKRGTPALGFPFAAPADAVTQQPLERLGLPRAAKQLGGTARGVHAGVDGRLDIILERVTVTQRDVRHHAPADPT